ncbi:membrane fusion protein (multidrug efflux system) [Rhodoblastus acidophilus]|uniref:HlyD family secretion protein n=1 Tax=Rhodoblastus acidophilus TaxID=1074 RepID=UPI002224595C|nr:HlyD family secretion protein [Rhodoblastus acidophilus]MCW2318994.1 membrane fusion protein (multidrug efflux system) [Rhodoblastus acidophilus]
MALKLGFPHIAGLCVALAVAGGFFILNRPDSASAAQATDDAYIAADVTQVAPQIAGRIDKVLVEDNQAVAAGAPLVEIDDREARIALAGARARLSGAEAALAGLAAQIEQQASQIRQAEATLDADAANLALAVADRARFANLARDGAGAKQAAQEAEARWRAQVARQQADFAALAAARKQTAVLEAARDRATADRDGAIAARDAAALNLSFARIAAPIAGVIAQKKARPGNYVRPGEPLFALAPLEKIYVAANFRETQLAHVRPGQKVDVTVDAYPGEVFKGEVESLGPASEVSFSPVPPHNATGNFTKIAQRLPVRIRILPDQKQGDRLKVGMSVHPSIATAP